MEMFYIVTEKCSMHDLYFRNLTFRKRSQEIYSQIKKDFGIEATKYVPRPERLSIVATSSDSRKFATQMMKSDARGVRSFKIKSDVNAVWVEKFNAASLKFVRAPSPAWELGIMGSGQYSLFDYEGKLYMSLSFPDSDMKDFEGCTQMRGSDFYKVVEAVQTANKC